MYLIIFQTYDTGNERDFFYYIERGHSYQNGGLLVEGDH